MDGMFEHKLVKSFSDFRAPSQSELTGILAILRPALSRYLLSYRCGFVFCVFMAVGLGFDIIFRPDMSNLVLIIESALMANLFFAAMVLRHIWVYHIDQLEELRAGRMQVSRCWIYQLRRGRYPWQRTRIYVRNQIMEYGRCPFFSRWRPPLGILHSHGGEMLMVRLQDSIYITDYQVLFS